VKWNIRDKVHKSREVTASEACAGGNFSERDYFTLSSEMTNGRRDRAESFRTLWLRPTAGKQRDGYSTVSARLDRFFVDQPSRSYLASLYFLSGTIKRSGTYGTWRCPEKPRWHINRLSIIDIHVNDSRLNVEPTFSYENFPSESRNGRFAIFLYKLKLE